jgi:hypothetical protein
MSKGGAPDVTTNAVDPDIKQAFLTNFMNAQGVASALPTQQFAGFNPMYQAGEEALVNTALAGPGISGTDLAAQMAAQAGVYQPAQIQGLRSNLGLGGGQMSMPQYGGGSGGIAPAAQGMAMGGVGQGPTPPELAGMQANYFSAKARGEPVASEPPGMDGRLMGSGFNGFSNQFMPQTQQPQANQQIGSIADYMNPYTSQVRANALADLETARQSAIRQGSERATQARAFGGSRQGVAEGITNLGFARQAGTLGTQLNENAFNSAVALQQADIARQQQADLANQQAGLQGAQLRLSGANQLGGLAGQQQALRLGGAQAVMGAGGARQAAEQQQMDAIRNIGLQRLGIVQSSLGAQPANLGGTVSTPMYSNTGAGALGGALAGAQLGSVIPGVGTAVGAIGGGLLGLLR